MEPKPNPYPLSLSVSALCTTDSVGAFEGGQGSAIQLTAATTFTDCLHFLSYPTDTVSR